MNRVPAEISAIIKRHKRILIAGHIRPDGDAVGSCAAMGWLGRSLDREVILYNHSGFPETLSWLKLPSPLVRSAADLPGPPDLIVALDSGDLRRLGDDLKALFGKTPSLVIDHHLDNPRYGSLFNWVEPKRSSVGEMVALLAKSLNVPLTGPLAEAAYLAIATDTGGFAYSNTTPETLRLCAEMMENGLNAAELRDRIDNNWSEARLRLWGEVMTRAAVLEKGRLAVGSVTRDMLASHGATGEDSEGLVEQLRRLRGVRVAMLMTELEPGGEMKTKISLRSSGSDNVQAVAFQFGGGGHKNAAGAALPLPPDKTLSAVIPYIAHIWSKDEYKKSLSCAPSSGALPETRDPE